ncbi:hypothetical protein ScPMuIL_012629 [Solemya velum]
MDTDEKDPILLVLKKAASGHVLDKRECAIAINEYRDQQTRLREAMSVRAVAQDEMIVRKDEWKKLNEKLKYHQRKFKELEQRVSSIKGLHSPLSTPGRDMADATMRTQFAFEYRAIYDDEWRLALNELKILWKWPEDQSINILSMVTKHAYSFLQTIAREQFDCLKEDMEIIMMKPRPDNYLNADERTPRKVYTKGLEAAQKALRTYRKERAQISVPAVQELFMREKMSSLWDTHRMEKNLKQYVNKVVRVTWLMAVQEPAMMLHWQDTSDRVKKDLFDFHGRQGDTVSVTVWPAVSAHETGNLISKDYDYSKQMTEFKGHYKPQLFSSDTAGGMVVPFKPGEVRTPNIPTIGPITGYPTNHVISFFVEWTSAILAADVDADDVIAAAAFKC